MSSNLLASIFPFYKKNTNFARGILLNLIHIFDNGSESVKILTIFVNHHLGLLLLLINFASV